MPRLYVTLTDEELQVLNDKSADLGFTSPQYGRYLILEGLGLPQPQPVQILDLYAQIDRFLQGLKPEDTFDLTSPFLADKTWWKLDAYTKRKLSGYFNQRIRENKSSYEPLGSPVSHGAITYRYIGSKASKEEEDHGS